MTPRFSVTASVISYNYVRYLCATLGFGLRRDDDYLLVYREPESGLYVKKDTTQEPIGEIYIDEGYFSDAMYEGFEYKKDKFIKLPNSRSWEEYVDATSFMRVLCAALAPDHEFDYSPYHGRGKTKRFMQDQYAIVLLELADTDCLLKHWEFLN